MKVIVTGGTGFIGRHTLNALVNAGHDVLALHRRAIPSDHMGVTWLESPFDDLDWSGITAFMNGEKGVLLHLLAHGVDPVKADWDGCFLWNVTHSLKFWRESILKGIFRIITCGSCFEYGAAGDRYEFIPSTVALEPLSPYAASKAAASMALCGLAASEKVQALSIRPCVVYGEGEADNRLWPSLRRAAISGVDFPMTTGSQVRDFVAVEYVARRLSESVDREDLPNGRLIIENIGSGQAKTVLEFATEWWSIWGGKGKLLVGALPSRASETQRLVPFIDRHITIR